VLGSGGSILLACHGFGPALSPLPKQERTTVVRRLACEYGSDVIHRLGLRAALFVGAAGILLGVSEGSDHRMPVLPSDASAAGVIPAAVLCAIVASAIAEANRWRRS